MMNDPPERNIMGREIVALLPRLRRFAAGLTGSMQEGDDVVQAACLRALERHRQFQEGSRLDSWLFTIIRTVWLDRRKSAWSRMVRSEPERLAEMPGRSLDHELEARSDWSQARRAIAVLPEDQRQALLLVTVEGMSYEAVAAMLGIPTGTVLSRVARARVAVARFMTDAAQAPSAKFRQSSR
ncbi:MAG TPA: RNA polymerase sigma factor [Dongiaceae bacterium]|jgi:RNA polymerase sigma-70 factor (ECF subfamily)